MQDKPDAVAGPDAKPAPASQEPVLETRRRDPSGWLGHARANVRLSAHVRKLFGLMLLLLLLMAFYGYRLYQKEIKPVLQQVRSGAVIPATIPPPSPVARAIEIQLPAETRRQLDEHAAQLGSLKKQLAEASAKWAAQQREIEGTRALQARQEEHIKRLSEQLEAVKSAPQTPPAPLSGTAPPASTADAAGLASENPATSALEEPQSPGLAELRLMKERNRLSAYADEAISTGDRRPLNLLIEAMKDPERVVLYHAARSEYYRIMGHYQLINRIDPAYKLPISELFPEGKIRDEADLSTPQIIELLRNRDLDWQTRLRAAYLLGGRRTPEVGEALLRALKEDPNLDVAKEAQLSFEQNVGRSFLLFDIPGIDAWWRSQVPAKTSASNPPEN